MRMNRPNGHEEVHLAQINLADPNLYGLGNPHPIWHHLRANAPVYWQDVGEGRGFWSVTKYDDVEWVLKDHTTFTSARGTLLNLLDTDDPAGGQAMATTDPPKHTCMRQQLNLAMNQKGVERYVDSIRSEVHRLLAPAVTGEVFDFAEATAALSTAIAGIMMGVPRADWPLLTRLGRMCIAPEDPEYCLAKGPKATLRQGHRELYAYFQDEMAQREQQEPGHDLLSVMLAMDINGRAIEPGEIVANCYSMFLGASVTTPHVPAAALLELIETGGYDAWTQSSEHIQTTVEEASRWASPANHFMRHATQDVDIRGTRIKGGQAVVAWVGSADRDEDVFTDPYTFDYRRHPNRHLAFGAGPHYCIGHTAARRTLRILLETMCKHFAGFELAGEVEHLCSDFVAGIKHLPVVAKPRLGAAEALREPAVSS
jgi:cytochrome P450